MSHSPSPRADLPFDDPAAYVAEDRRLALVGGPPVDGRVRGSVLFADVSGFTAMTETLAGELGEQRGAELLAATLERVFGELIGELHRWGGSVVYFSGDAVTCWLGGDDGRRGTACGFGMQDVMDRVGIVTTPGGTTLRLRVKVAVAAGEARRFVVGDPAIQLIDVLAGSLMDEVAAAESVAEPGDVVVTGVVAGSLRGAAMLEERGAVLVVRGRPTGVPPASERAAAELPALPDEVTRHWLLPDVLRRMRAGHGEFLAELRPGVPFFVRFGGLDFDTDPGAPQRLDAFVVAVQRVVDGHGGNLLQLTVGDKGAYLYAVFGAPIAHEDDAARACAAALEVSRLEAGAVVDVTVGVASGRLRSGTYGHRGRRTYCCLGDAVNLAARLMAKAEPGSVLVSAAVAAAAGDRFRYGERRTVALKGRAHGTEAVALVAEQSGARTGDGGLPPVVGRGEEIQRLVRVARTATRLPADRDATRLVLVTAEVGAGKTRVVSEAVDLLRRGGTRVVTAVAPTRGVVPAYAGWWPVWRELMGVDREAQAGEVLATLARRVPAELHPRLPLLGSLLGIPLPENDLTDALDVKLRKTSLEQLAVLLLGRLAAHEPLVVVIDDAHALDPLSRDLLVEVSRVLAELPVALVLAARPDDDPWLGLPLEELTRAEELALDRLSDDETRSLAGRLLHSLLEAPAPGHLVDLVAERAGGNPLWVRELCRFLHERSVSDRSRPPDAADLPDTLQGLVLGRLDHLDETSRRTAKVASVVGRRFGGPLVRRAWPDLGEESEVRRAFKEQHRRGLVTPVDLTTDQWAFTHGVLRDVAYESLPIATRSLVHDAVAAALESGDFGPVDRLLDTLAHHAWHGGDPARQRVWLRRAGEAAQAGYANETALLHYRRLLGVVEGPERAEVQVRIGKVLELGGDWDAAAQAYDEARATATDAGDLVAAAWANTWLAEVARKRRRFDEARVLLTEAGEAFARLGDDAGAAQVWHIGGTCASQQGRFDEAAELYRRSLAVRERIGDRAGAASLLSNLAIGEEALGRYDAAGELGEQALAIRREIGDRWAVGVSLNNLGMLALLRGDPAGARERFTESMALHEQVGDVWLVALGQHNLGNAHRDLGERELARASYARALAAYRGFGDEWALALLYEDAALLVAAASPADAWRLVGASDVLHERTETPRTPDVTARIEEVLGSRGETRARREGRAMTDAEVEALVSSDATAPDRENHHHQPVLGPDREADRP